MNNVLDECELKTIWEAHRSEFSDKFPKYADYIESGLADSQWPTLRLRDGEPPNPEINILNAALKELHLLLCTKEKRYTDVRKSGTSFVKVALPTISAYLAGACGVSIGIASGALALVALAVLRLGQGVFCRISLPPK